MIISHNIPRCEEYGNMMGAIRKYDMKRLKAVTLIEVLIAIVITGMVLSSMLTGLIFANKYARHNANKTMALNFAQGLMEEIRNKEYEDEYATNVNYHSGDYANFLGPELAENDLYKPNDDDDDPQGGTITENEFDDVDDYNRYNPDNDPVNLYLYQKEGVSIPAKRRVTVTDQNDNDTLDNDSGTEGVPDYHDVTYKKIKVTVSWDWQGKSYSEEVNTIVCDWGT